MYAFLYRLVAGGFETGRTPDEVIAEFERYTGLTYGTDTVPPLAQRPDEQTLAALHGSIPPQPRHVAVLLAGALGLTDAAGGAIAPSGT